MTHQPNTRPSTGWLLLAVVVQAAIGASMVPLRYLQTVAQLPGLAVIALTDLVAFGIMSWQILTKVNKRFWRSTKLWVMLATVILRTIFLTFAVRFTKAYIVQLIKSLAPYFVVLLNKIFIKRPLPLFTIPAISASLVGGGLMVFGGLVNQSMTIILTPKDGIGIFFAFLATFWIAGYMMIVKRGQEVGLPIVTLKKVGRAAGQQHAGYAASGSFIFWLDHPRGTLDFASAMVERVAGGCGGDRLTSKSSRRNKVNYGNQLSI